MDVLRPPAARLVLFGFAPTAADVELVARTTAWRLRRSAALVAITILAAPVAFMIPPHAPWGAGVLLGGGLLAIRRWRERFTIARAEGPCPKCGGKLSLPSGTRLRVPHPVPCEGCGHEPLLRLG